MVEINYEDIYQGADYLFKVGFFGDSSVGKSSLIRSVSGLEFIDNLEPTIGIDLKICNFSKNNKNVKLQLWEVPTCKKYVEISKSYLRGMPYLFMVFDLSNQASFNNLCEFYQLNKSDMSVYPILIGCKNDLKHVVDAEHIEIFSKENNLVYYEVSNKDENIKTLKEFLIAKAIENCK